MKSNIILWTLLAIFINIPLFAQDKIVTKKGDTLKVYIIKSFKATNSKKLSYKIAQESTSEEVLLPSQVQYFNANGNYESVLISSEGSENQYLFLQKAIDKGKVHLYKGIDEQGNPDFFIRKDDKVIIVDKLNLTAFIEKFFLDCPNFAKERYLPAKIENYRQDYLMDLISYYNNCSDSQTYPYIQYYSFPKPKRKDEIHFGVKAGGGIQEYAYRSFSTTANLNLYGTGVFNPKMSLAGGIYANVQYGKIFSTHLELLFLYRNAKSTDGAINMRFSGLNIPFILEFNLFNKKKTHPFINAGLNSVVGIGSKYTVTPPSGFQILRPLSMSPVSFGSLIGGGIYLDTANKPIKIEARFSYDFFEVNNITIGSDKMRNANFMIMASYPLL
ncbi:MAG: hypothetical protein MUC49_09040 [Raineya sp.]|jgi:hypothetical protein|nr:hypothetical protein [Raineya sp.]